MRTFSSTTGVEQPATSNRRQPARQARTNPARTASNLTGDPLTQAQDTAEDATPGFFPAITHFADAITALPKEMVRHYTMLKEVDAKIYGPEEVLSQLLPEALRAPRQPRPGMLQPQAKQGKAPTQGPTQESSHQRGDLARRTTFQNLRVVMAEMLMTLDEKNHVMHTAIDTLDRQLKRCQSSFTHIEGEISEEARYGSLSHWAYTTDKTTQKTGIMAGERTRRAANNLAAATAAHEAEGAAMRSEARREALAARKHRIHQLDSDFDDGRALSKKAQAGAKNRKPADNTFTVGLGIANGAAPPNKRRKIEKPAMGGFPMDRAMSSVYGSSAAVGRGRVASPKDTLAVEASSKKKGRGGATVGSTTRKRGNTGASAVNSPTTASSPITATFAVAKELPAKNPAPAALQRVPSSRARQNSTQSAAQLSRNQSSSNNHKVTNGNGLHGAAGDVEKVPPTTGKAVTDVKSSLKETVNAKSEQVAEEAAVADGPSEPKGTPTVGSKNGERGSKREEGETGNGKSRADRPPAISISTRGVNSKQPSKNATPLTATFSEPRTRLPRNTDLPHKRSHKKGAGAAAQLAAAKAREDEGSSVHGEEEEDEKNEPRYCYCQGISYGEMVACDNNDCPREWFHLTCVGLAKPPPRSAQWYCDECKESLKKVKVNGGNGR